MSSLTIVRDRLHSNRTRGQRADIKTINQPAVVRLDLTSEVAQLAVGDAVFWVAAAGPGGERLVPNLVGRAIGRILLLVDDPDTTFARAVEAGGKEHSAVGVEHGWQAGRIVDPFGQEWEVGKPGIPGPPTTLQSKNATRRGTQAPRRWRAPRHTPLATQSQSAIAERDQLTATEGNRRCRPDHVRPPAFIGLVEATRLALVGW
jgi:PhnB protein